MKFCFQLTYFLLAILISTSITNAQTSLDWVGAIDGTGSELGYEIDKDQNNNIYVCGSFTGSANFKLNSGTISRSSNGSTDAFLAKYSKNGDLIWVKVFGGGINDAARRLKVGLNGAVYITGTFGGTVDFDPSSGTDNHSTVFREDVFVSKFDTSGNWIWTKTFGGNQNDKVNALEIDNNENIYIGGEFEDTVDFNPGVSYNYRISTGGSDGYVLSLDSSGNYRWVTTFSGSQTSDEFVRAIKVNQTNELIVAHESENNMTGPDHVSISKYSLSGVSIWSKVIQGSSIYIGDIEIDNNNNIIAVGQYSYAADFDASNNDFILIARNGTNGYILKYNQNGDFVWVKDLNTQYTPNVNSLTALFKVKVNQKGNIFAIGRHRGATDLDPDSTKTIIQQSKDESDDFLIASYDKDGKYSWHESFGGSENESAFSCELLGNNEIVTIGLFSGSVSFNPNDSTKNILTTLGGGFDVFVQKLSYCPPTYESLTVTGCNDYYAPSGKKYTTSGIFTDTISNAEGCDSIITIDLTISSIDTSVVRLGGRLIANADNAFYQWVDCNNNFAIINGADEQSFAPENSGMYAVIVLKNSCQDTSVCFLSVGLDELSFSKRVTVSPNPTDGISFISLPERYKSVEVKVRNTQGQIVFEELYRNTKTIEISLLNKPGVYFLELNTAGVDRGVIKVVKQ